MKEITSTHQSLTTDLATGNATTMGEVPAKPGPLPAASTHGMFAHSDFSRRSLG